MRISENSWRFDKSSASWPSTAVTTSYPDRVSIRVSIFRFTFWSSTARTGRCDRRGACFGVSEVAATSTVSTCEDDESFETVGPHHGVIDARHDGAATADLGHVSWQEQVTLHVPLKHQSDRLLRTHARELIRVED